MNRILIYTTPNCPYCISAKNFLKSLNLPFEEIDVSNNPKAIKDLILKTNQIGVPVFELDDIVIVGFDKMRLFEVLKKKNLID